jgi:RNA polymerase sigma-70 factor (ECF subfamily)
VNDRSRLAGVFDAERSRLKALASRLLGSRNEAEDAVQEAWIRLDRTDSAELTNVPGWLTTVVSRICLDTLRARSRNDALLSAASREAGQPSVGDAAENHLFEDSIADALHAVATHLTPAERVAYVMHDLFALSFEDIAAVVGRSPQAARQLASRARRRVQSIGEAETEAGERQQSLVTAFLEASRTGNMQALLSLLAPNVVLIADAVAVKMGAAAETHGADAVAATFKGRAMAALPALIDGLAGLVFAPGGQLRVLFDFIVTDGRISEVFLVADPQEHRQIDVKMV